MFFVFSYYVSATLVTLSLDKLLSSPFLFLASSKVWCVQWRCGNRPALFKCLQYQQVIIDGLDIAVFATILVFIIQTEEFPKSFPFRLPFSLFPLNGICKPIKILL